MDKFLIGIKKGFELYGETITLVINSLLLTIVYFLGVGTTSIMAKIVGKRFLDLNFNEKKSYWEEVDKVNRNKEPYYRQF